MHQSAVVMKTSMIMELTLAGFLTTSLFQSSAEEPKLPAEVIITSKSTTHVHAVISDLPVQKFPALAKMHALFTVYFNGSGATDEKLKALAQLPFTNLACVVFTDCYVVTDRGIEHISRIPTLTRLGLRQMSITDAACDMMVRRMRLTGVNTPNCTNVTVNGLLKMAQSELMESFGFSVGEKTQGDLIRLIRMAGPKMNRMDIEMLHRLRAVWIFPLSERRLRPKGFSYMQYETST